MVNGPMACVKYLLFCFNFLFMISGITILLVGTVIESAYFKYENFLDDDLSKPPLILFWTGVAILAIALCGFFGAARENRCLINTFAVLLCLIFLLELGAGIAAYYRSGDVEEMLERKFNESMTEYPKQIQVQKSWDLLQQNFDCCGTTSPKDWNKVFNNATLPNTCCGEMPKNSTQGCTIDFPTVSTQGCLPHLRDLVVANAHTLGLVGIGIAIAQVVGVVFAFSLAHTIGKEYETV